MLQQRASDLESLKVSFDYQVHLSPSRLRQLCKEVHILDHSCEEDTDSEDPLSLEVPPKPVEVSRTTGERLIIKDIVVDNFKSYEGRHQLGPLHKNLTMIIGPNGSGKSNVIDAILFVFGLNHMKLRTMKLSSLIYHNGVERAEMAMVEIHFQSITDLTSSKYFTNGQSYRIARSIHDNNKSNFFINGELTTLETIHKLLQKEGINLTNNRFLILQGEVEKISMMKPKSVGNEDGILEYIENSVGSCRYKDITMKVEKKLKRMELQLAQKQSSHIRVLQEIYHLEPIANDAMRLINKNNELLMLQGMLLKLSYARIQFNVHLGKKDLEALGNELKEKEIESKDAQNAYSSGCDDVKRVEETYNNLLNDRTVVESKLADWKKDDNRFKAEMENSQKDKKDIKSKIRATQQNIQVLELAPAQYKVDIAKTTKKLEKATKLKDDIKTESMKNLELYEETVAPMKEELEKVNKEFGEINPVELVELEEELREKMGEMEGTGGLAKEEVEKELERVREELRKKKGQLEEDQRNLPIEEDRLKTLQTELIRENIQLNGVIDKRNFCIREKKRVDDELAKTGKSAKLDQITYLMSLKKQGRLKGFIGRLGDHSKTDPKYDTMISTNFSSVFDMLIVQTREEAAEAINELHAKKLRKMRFSVIDEVNKNHDGLEGIDDTDFPGPRIIDVIEFATEDCRNAAYNFIGDTLFAETLEEARQLNKRHQSYSVADLCGSIVSSNGNITGGEEISGKLLLKGVDQRSDRSGLLIQRQELQLEYDGLLGEERELKKSVVKRKARIGDAKGDLTHLRLRIKEATFEVARLESSVANLETRSFQCPNLSKEEIDAKKKIIEDLENKIAQIKSNLSSINETRFKLNRQIDEAYARILQSPKSYRLELTEEIKRLQEQLCHQQALLDSNPEHLRRAKEELSQLEEDLKEEKWEAERLKGLDTEKHKEKGMELMGKLEDVQKRLSEALAELNLAITNRTILFDDQQEKSTSLRNHRTLITECKIRLDGYEEDQEVLIEKLEKIQVSWWNVNTVQPDVDFVEVSEKCQDDDKVLISEYHYSSIDYSYPRILDEMDPGTLTLGEITKHSSTVQEKIEIVFNEINKIDRKDDMLETFGKLLFLYHAFNTASKDLTVAVKACRIRLNELRDQRYTEFMSALDFLNQVTQTLYKMLAGAGDAALKLVEGSGCKDPFAQGVQFNVRPPNKSWKVIANLSGGEKTLASLCFVFAMHHFRPNPFYVMDEIDASLDPRNVWKVAQYLKMTTGVQLIIVSLRNQMFEHASRLVGIYNTENSTKHCIVAPEDVMQIADSCRTALLREVDDVTKKMEVVKISQKRAPKRKLGPLKLSDFGIDLVGSSSKKALTELSEDSDEEPEMAIIEEPIGTRTRGSEETKNDDGEGSSSS